MPHVSVSVACNELNGCFVAFGCNLQTHYVQQRWLLSVADYNNYRNAITVELKLYIQVQYQIKYQ